MFISLHFQATLSVILLSYLIPTMTLSASFELFGCLLLQGLCGMCFGLFLSVQCQRRDQVIQLGIGAVLPTLILSGTLWPREAMPELLEALSDVLPVTATCDLAKAIVLKNGALLTTNALQSGIFIPISWSIFFIFVCGFNVQSWLLK